MSARPRRASSTAVARTADRGASPSPVAPWADAACLLAGALTPLLFHPFGTLGFEATKSVLVRLLALVLVLGWFARRAGRLRPPIERAEFLALPRPVRAVALAVAGYVLAHLVATALSIAPTTSLWGSYDRIQGLVTTLAWVTLGVAAAVAGREPTRRRALVDVWLLASVPVCLYGLAQQFRLDPIDWLNRPLGAASTLGSSTALGTYLAMLIPLTLARTVAASDAWQGHDEAVADKKPRSVVDSAAREYAAWVGLLALQVVVLGLTWVRGGGLGMLAGIGVAAAALAWRRRRRSWVLVGILFAVVLATGLLATAISSSADADDSSARQRLLIWGATLETVAASWRAVVGFGPETQALALEARFPAELANRYPDARYDRAHNLLLDQLLTTGLLGVAALVGLVAALAGVGVRALRGGDDRQAVLSAGLLGGLAANVVANLYAFDSTATGALFWLMAGLLVAPLVPRDRPGADAVDPEPAPRRRPDPEERVRARLAPPARLIVTASLAAAVLGLAALPPIVGPMMADLYHTRALALRAGEAPAASISPELAAIDWAPGQDVYAIALGETYLEIARTTEARASAGLTSFEDLWLAVPSGRDGLLQAGRLALERAVELNPLDPYGHLHLARFWTLQGDVSRDPAERTDALARAVAEYDHAIAASPNRATFYDESAVALTRLGQPERAIERLRQAESLDRPTSERLARIGDAEVVRGDSAAARALYTRALELDPRSGLAEHGLALLDRAAGDLASALEHAQRASRFQMRNWIYHRDLALLYRDLEQWPEALVEARAARRYAPAWEWDELSELVESVRR